MGGGSQAHPFPVIANAIYDAISIRLYELPMTPTRIKKAIKNNSG
jgi:CO/xanthine dehydrogenase Mo-binding subunit